MDIEAEVAELVYAHRLERCVSACGFESHLQHHL